MHFLYIGKSTDRVEFQVSESSSSSFLDDEKEILRLTAIIEDYKGNRTGTIELTSKQYSHTIQLIYLEPWSEDDLMPGLAAAYAELAEYDKEHPKPQKPHRAKLSERRLLCVWPSSPVYPSKHQPPPDPGPFRLI